MTNPAKKTARHPAKQKAARHTAKQKAARHTAKHLATILVPVAALFVFGLANCAKNPTEEENFIVPPGKADDFFSMTAQEYVVEGTATVTLEDQYANETEEIRMARVKELIGYKHVVIEWFLNEYIIDKSDHDGNENYGGFKSMVKAGAYEDLDIQLTEGLTYSFKFNMIVGGTNDLLSILPTQDLGDGKRQFTLQMGRISNTDMAKLEINNEWYRNAPWSDFDPSKHEPQDLEPIVLTIWPETRSSDAWIDYNRLYADNLVTISVYFGWDYHSEYHLKHSERFYSWLTGTMGFTSPVDSYEQYTRTSGPLTRTFKANGREVTAQIWIHWGKPGTDTDPDTDAGGRVLENDMREDFRTKEVVIFSGHSGYLYGFALANWRRTEEGDLDDSEIPGLEMPPNVYQLVIAEGCDTYAMGEAFWNNPNKPGHANLDVVTTTSYSNATSPAAVQDIVKALVPSPGRDHEPKTYSEMLRDLDTNSYWFNTMYGVHGTDDNPKVHPYANLALLCKPCSSSSDCRDGAVEAGSGNQCTRLNENEKVCTAFCTDDAGCPEGYACMKSAQSDGYIHSKQCVPRNLSCTEPDPEPVGPAVIINEVLADPPPDLSGDANGDGSRSYSQDEFVELVNITNEPVDLSGYTISDGVRVRFTFPENTVLAPGRACVVFGGGIVSQFNVPGDAMIFASQDILALTNTGDTVTLADPEGNTVDAMSYGSEGGHDRSLVRAVDGDPEASFIPHPGGPFSAGTRQDGSPF